MSKRKFLCIIPILGLLLLIGSILLLVLMGEIFRSQVNSNIPLKDPSSQIYPIWVNQGGDVFMYFSFSFFNLTNPDEFAAGAKPELKVIGPYVYREFLWKENVTWSEDGTTISYSYHNPFVFVGERSGNLQESDMITLPNFPILGLLQDPVLGGIITTPGSGFDINMTITRTVKELLFGYVDPTLAELHAIFNKGNPIVSLMESDYDRSHKASSQYSGTTNASQTTQMKTWCGSNKLWTQVFAPYPGPLWGSDEANTVQGSDGWQFPPNVKSTDKLRVFIDILHRSLDLVNIGTSEYHGIKSLLYTIDPAMFSNATPSYNEAYYMNAPQGVMNVTSWQMAAIFISKPYFLDADPYYRRMLSDSFPQPDRYRDDTFVMVEPQTGAGLHAYKRTQANVYINSSKFNQTVNWTKTLPVVYCPIVIFDEEIAPPDAVTDVIKASVFAKEHFFRGLMWSIFGVSLAALIVSGIVFAYFSFRPVDEYSQINT